MKINSTNYEIFFLDYHEGNLPAEQVAELFLFLEENPQLKPEFDSFENISLPGSSLVSYPDKALLKKGFIDEHNYTRFFVGHVEGTLDENEKRLLVEFLEKYPAYHRDLTLFEKTKLQPDVDIVYNEKRDLKKPVPLFGERTQWYYIAAAACVLLLLGAFFMLQLKTGGLNMAERPGKPVQAPAPSDKHENSGQQDQENKTDVKTPGPAEIKNSAERQMNPEPQIANRANRPIHHNRKVKQGQANSPSVINEEIALLTPIDPELTSTDHDVNPVMGLDQQVSSDYHTLTASTSVTSYPSIGQLIRRFSTNKMEEAINDKHISDDLRSRRVSAKVKSIKLMGWCLNKVTGKKVNVKTTYNPQGELTAYRISAGRLQFGKTFASR